MIKFNLSVVSIIFIFLSATIDLEAQTKKNLLITDLSGKVFKFGMDFDENNCNVTGSGQASIMLFINDKEFVEDSRKPDEKDNDHIVSKGTYALDGFNLVLKYDSTAAKLDYYKEKYNTIIMSDERLRIYDSFTCKQKFRFDLNSDGEYSHGSQLENKSVDEYQKKLQQEGVWSALLLPEKKYPVKK
jgi:hypothetical protein